MWYCNGLKRICAALLLVVLILALVGCAKCISVEYKKVNMTIVRASHTPYSATPVRVGKTWTISVKPATYRIIVQYDDISRTFSDKDTYEKYKNMVGSIVIGTLEIATYDDGTVEHHIISLG